MSGFLYRLGRVCVGALVSTSSIAATAEIPEIQQALPRVSLYATISEAIAARDLYGALEFAVPPVALETPAPEGEPVEADPESVLTHAVMVPDDAPVLDSVRNGCPEILASLVRAGHRLYQVDSTLNSALHLAAQSGRIYTLDLLVRKGVPTRTWNAEGFRPLHTAARYGQEEALQALLHYDFDLYANSNNSNPLQAHQIAMDFGQYGISRLLRRMGVEMSIFRMAGTGDAEGVRESITQTPRNREAQDGVRNTPLMTAIIAGHKDVVEVLLDAGAELKTSNIGGHSPLSLATQYDREEIVRLLIDRGASLQQRRESLLQESLMAELVEFSSVKMLELLIELGAPVDDKDNEGYTPLQRAVAKSDAAKVEVLLKAGADVNTQNAHGVSTLHTALEARSMPMALLLMEHGADPELRDENRRTPMHLACASGLAAMFDLLTSFDARADQRDINGMTPAMDAAANGRTDLLRRMVAMGIDVSVRDREGRTALHHAVIRGDAETAAFLLESGSDANAVDRHGRPPLYYALLEERDALARLIERHDGDLNYRFPDGRSLLYVPLHENFPTMTQWLLDQGLSVKDADKNGWTPLHQAAKVGSQATIELFLGLGADPNAADSLGRTPLHIASERGHILVIKALAEGGAVVDLLDHAQWLPMHYSAQHGHWGPIQYFLLRGIDLDTPIPDGRTALHLCIESGMMRTVMLLYGKGADMLHQDNAGRTPLALMEAKRHFDDINVCRTPKQAEAEIAGQMTHNYLRLAYCEFMDALLKSGDMERLSRLLELHPEYANIQFLGWTPLQRAVRYQQPEAIALLLDAQANPAGRDETGLGQTALHLAAALNAPGIAEVLADAAPNLLSETDAKGRTPEQVARESGAEELAQRLSQVASPS